MKAQKRDMKAWRRRGLAHGWGSREGVGEEETEKRGRSVNVKHVSKRVRQFERVSVSDGCAVQKKRSKKTWSMAVIRHGMIVLRVEYEAYREKGGGEAQVQQDLQGVASEFHAVYQNLERGSGSGSGWRQIARVPKIDNYATFCCWKCMSKNPEK